MAKSMEDKSLRYPLTEKELADAEKIHKQFYKVAHPRLSEFDKGRIQDAITLLVMLKHRSYDDPVELATKHLAWWQHYSTPEEIAKTHAASRGK